MSRLASYFFSLFGISKALWQSLRTSVLVPFLSFNAFIGTVLTTLLIANLTWELVKLGLEFLRRLFGHAKPVVKASAPLPIKKQPFSSPLKDSYSATAKATTASPLLWSPKSVHAPSIASPLTSTANTNAATAVMSSPTMSAASKKKRDLFSANLDQFIHPPASVKSPDVAEKKDSQEKTLSKNTESNANEITGSAKNTSKSTLLTRQVLSPEMVSHCKLDFFFTFTFSPCSIVT